MPIDGVFGAAGSNGERKYDERPRIGGGKMCDVMPYGCVEKQR